MHFPVLLLLLSLLLLIHLPMAISDDILWTTCPTDVNYTTKSTFQSNLNLLLSSLSSAAVPSGFANDTVGRYPNQVYGLALCRGDLSPADCRSCLNTSIHGIVEQCPHGMSSTIWYEDCLLRYSNTSFFSMVEPVTFYMSNTNNVSQPTLFNTLLGQLMDTLAQKAAYGSPRMFATGTANFTSFQKIYGLAQCTRDLSDGGCYRCLTDAISNIPACCDAKQGGRVKGETCYIRYEVAPFYNLLTIDDAPTPAPAVSPPREGIPATLPVHHQKTEIQQIGKFIFSFHLFALAIHARLHLFARRRRVSLRRQESSDLTRSNSDGSNRTTKTIVIVAIAVAVVLSFLFAICIFLRRRKPVKSLSVQNAPNGGNEEEFRSAESLLFDLGTIRAATNNFSEANKLGEGGFGPVYKGILQDGQEIAVKRLSTSSAQGLIELRNEVILVAKLQHKNLVRLLGFCLEEQEKLLVYEYLQNTSLDKIIFDPVKRELLNWGRRYKLIEGIARGLLYLHEDSRLRIIHRDLKASNILLDGDMNPKISDFGLAKLFDVDATQGNTNRIAGTYGYMSPEYALYGQFSAKSDVFSFGVLILEIVTGRRNTLNQDSMYSEDLLSYVWNNWRKGAALQVLDRCLAEECRPQDVLRCIHIGLLCIQEDPSERPTMASVILMLNSQSITLPSPSTPAFVISSRTFNEPHVLGRERNADLPGSRSRGGSVNDVSISEMEPR
ncbi:cysteine-rich receptor-like protein kinase 15 [Typha latifolia]|uniref:cysteine-rich receptor-like protein kinase 15 n=1 Tax=Typha latifolia TaxID=4733 RepID=UPI003C2CDDDF